MVLAELRGRGTEPTEEVDLSDASLGDFDAALLAGWIKDNKTLKTLE